MVISKDGGASRTFIGKKNYMLIIAYDKTHVFVSHESNVLSLYVTRVSWLCRCIIRLATVTRGKLYCLSQQICFWLVHVGRGRGAELGVMIDHVQR